MEFCDGVKKLEEIWKDITDYEGLYQISNLGFVRSYPRNGTKNEMIYLSAWLDKYGYPKVTLSKNGKRKQFPIHRLVAKAFIDNPQNLPDVRFIDGNKLNAVYTNLEWCNMSNLPKIVRCGSFNTMAKFTEKQVKEIRASFIKGHKEYGCNGLAKKYGVSKSTMSELLNGKTYK